MIDFDVRQVLVSFIAIVMSITVHEFAHAFVADRLGDDTPRRHGRLTLNPIVLMRAYPFGSLVVPLIGSFTGFLAGWAATPVNPAKVRRDITIRKAEVLITAAGPISNGLFALLAFGLNIGFTALMVRGHTWAEAFVYLTRFLVFANVLLMLFNLVPIPPLDGFHILKAVSPGDGGGAVRFLEQYGIFLLLLLIVYAGRLLGPLFGSIAGLLHTAQSLVVP